METEMIENAKIDTTFRKYRCRAYKTAQKRHTNRELGSRCSLFCPPERDSAYEIINEMPASRCVEYVRGLPLS